MSRKDCPNKNWKYITYPRKCEECDHLSNNPSTYHYHQKKHELIPNGILCDGGCGDLARYKNTNNKYRCEKNWAHCPQYLIEHSKRIKTQWIGAEQRKQNAKETILKSACIPEVYEKARQTKYRKYFAQEHTQERKGYIRAICNLTQYTLKDNFDIINPDNLPMGTHEYHLDHKVSKHVGWLLKIPAQYIADIHNLELLYWKENNAKFFRCSYTHLIY